MTNGVPNIVPAIGGLVGIGIMAGVANEVIKTVGEQTQPKGKKKKVKQLINTQKPFSNDIEEKIRRMI